MINPPVLHERDEVDADAKRKGYSEPKCGQFPREESGTRREYHQGIPKMRGLVLLIANS
jgi:hypothetical protein